MHFVLIGASGYVGKLFHKHLIGRNHEVTTISRYDVDIYAANQLKLSLESIKPDYVINAAGFTGKPNVDACEKDKTNCLAGNAILPGVVGQACRDLKIGWGHVSSGCIYTGIRTDGTGFTELDEPNFTFRQNNCSFYSGTKALGEEIIANYDNCHIWRLRIPFSSIASPRNYLSKVLSYEKLLDAENSLSYLPEFVDAAIDCAGLRLPFGTYNLTNPGSVTTRQIVDLMRDIAFTSKKFTFFDSEDDFMRLAAETPRSNCVLNSIKAIEHGLKLTPIEDAITQSLKGWQESR